MFAGDVFKAIPFSAPPTELYESEDYEQVQHFFGPLAWAHGLLITATCDMHESIKPEKIAHPFRVLVPVLPLEKVVASTASVEKDVKLIRSRDSVIPYMYLPPLEGHFDESLGCLFRPTIVTDDFLADPPRRVAQLQQPARRQLKVKLAGYWGRAEVDPEDLDLAERGEDEAQTSDDPPSRYDADDRLR